MGSSSCTRRFRSEVVITLSFHAKGPRFEPGSEQGNVKLVIKSLF